MTSSFVLWFCLGCLIKMSAARQPNFVVFQPDDLPFFEQWTPPPHFPTRGESIDLPPAGLPHMERLRKKDWKWKGLMRRYPSRSAYGRNQNFDQVVATVTIPTTKLEDVDEVVDGNDCSENNIAALLSQNGYHTGVVGKWHLSHIDNGSYNYTIFQEEVRACGFDFAEALYAENMRGFWHDGSFNHNQEYVTAMALDFMDEAKKAEKPFFLYINPTVPHASGNVYDALTKFDCSDTPAGKRDIRPIKTMTAGTTCEDYRKSVIKRAAGSQSNIDLGAIWVDDSVGAIIQHLENNDELNNTFFLFQIDHGREGKGTLYEPGTRIAQFVHYPDGFGTQGKSFDGLVSTIDVGPTIMSYVGISDKSNGYYEMDGESWRSAVEDAAVATHWKADRCLAFELEQSRSITCDCYKYLSIFDTSSSSTASKGSRKGMAVGDVLLFNLCDSNNGEYLTSKSTSSEATDIKSSEILKLQDMKELQDCHLDMTNPSLLPRYSKCAIESTPQPTLAPTAPLSLPPSPGPVTKATSTPVSCEDAADGSFTGHNGVARTCKWVGKKAWRCN